MRGLSLGVVFLYLLESLHDLSLRRAFQFGSRIVLTLEIALRRLSEVESVPLWQHHTNPSFPLDLSSHADCALDLALECFITWSVVVLAATILEAVPFCNNIARYLSDLLVADFFARINHDNLMARITKEVFGVHVHSF